MSCFSLIYHELPYFYNHLHIMEWNQKMSKQYSWGSPWFPLILVGKVDYFGIRFVLTIRYGGRKSSTFTTYLLVVATNQRMYRRTPFIFKSWHQAKFLGASHQATLVPTSSDQAALASLLYWLVSSMPFRFPFNLPVLFHNDYFSQDN